MLLDTPVSRDVWIRPFVLESGAGPWGSFRWEGGWSGLRALGTF